MWIFAIISMFLLPAASIVAAIIGVISFVFAIIVGFVALSQKDGVAILIAITFLVGSLFLLGRGGYLPI
jgi:hypothetical protein